MCSAFFNCGKVCALVLCFSLCWLIVPMPAEAGYLDPGSGSILVQGIIAGLAFVGRIRRKIRGFFAVFTGKKA